MASKDSAQQKFRSVSEIKQTYLAKQTQREGRHSDGTSLPLTPVELLRKIDATRGSQKARGQG
jgi:hypothetical protein